jgi:5-methyltetrahydropteroyltriglutamate--homocysteine methyltransferase
MRSRPPFRADHVGSLLRPPALKTARERFARGEITADDLRAAEDAEIVEAIRHQEDSGLDSVTDGDFRRESWYGDFLQSFDGLEFFRPDDGFAFKSGESKSRGFRTAAPIRYSGSSATRHFDFLRERTGRTAKFTIPSPSMAFFRGLDATVLPEVYPDREIFLRDLGDAYNAAVADLAAAGCRYLQVDEVNFATICDPKYREVLRQRGDDPDALPGIYAGLINRAIEGRPTDMTVSMHMCRGNRVSSWMTEGGYEPIAELVFSAVDVDAYFMEYDDARSGGFEPLRFVPKGKTVVLGLVSSKVGTLEAKDTIKRRIDEAAAYIDPDQLCLSPQCGFASTEEGNLLSAEEQWAKLRLVVEVAREVWG